MHESFLVEQPRAPSDYRRTYMYNAARAEPPSDAAWAFPVEWIRLTNALKSVRAFLAFTSFKSHAWRGSPCWHRGPSLTPRASQQKTCLFHPAAGESHPSRLRAAISSQVTASASRSPNFTFPSLPVRQCVLISHRTPARLTHPDCEYFPPVGGRRGAPGQTILLLCLYLSNAASLDLPLDAGEVLLARQSYFLLSLPVQHGKSWSPVGRRRGAPGQTILFFLSLPVQHSEYQSPVGRRRGAPGQSNALPSARTKNIEPRRTQHTRPFWQS